MDFLNSIANFFNRPDQVADSTFNEILEAIERSEKCQYSMTNLTFPIGVLSCGHLFNSDALENMILEQKCPECGTTSEKYDRVLEDQSVTEVLLSYRKDDSTSTHEENQHSFDTRSDSPIPQGFEQQDVDSQSHISMKQKQLDQRSHQSQPNLQSHQPQSDQPDQDPDPLTIVQKDQISLDTVQCGRSHRSPKFSSPKISSPKISSPLVKHASPKISTRPSKFKYVHHASIKTVEKITDLDYQIWTLVTNVHLIKNSDQLLTKSTYFRATFDVVKHFLPKDLYRVASQLEPENLVDLLSKDRIVGTVLMYAMVLFLAIEYISRFRDFQTKSKYAEFFRAESFQNWLNSGYLKSTNLDATELNRLFKNK